MTESPLAPRTGEPPAETAARLRRLLDVSLALNAVDAPERLFRAIAETTAAVLGCEGAAVLLAEPEAGVLRFAAAVGSGADALADLAVPLDASLAGTIVRENRVLRAVDAARDARHFGAAPAAAGVVTRELLGVPMRLDGAPVGVLEAINPRPRPGRSATFDAADAEALLILAAQAAVAVRNARARAVLAAQAARAAELDCVRAEFVAVASHELRTPLAAVRGFAEVLAEDAPAALREPAAEVLAAARRMQAVVESLDELAARADAPRPTALVPLADLLSEADVLAGRPVDVALPAATVRVPADARRVRLALGHVLRNAAAFTPPEGRVSLRAEREPRAVVVRVEDTGRGIAGADLERIFEPFVQADRPDARPHEGLGVGLTIARRVARGHGGDLWATSPGPGRGATFHLRLPVAA